METFRGRTIRLERITPAILRRIGVDPLTTEPADVPSGLWYELPDVDYVLYRPGTPMSELAVRAHEYGHMAHGHRGVNVGGEHRVLHRTVYDEGPERDAEVFANLVSVDASAHTSTAQPLAGDIDPEVLRRLRETMES